MRRRPFTSVVAAVLFGVAYFVSLLGCLGASDGSPFLGACSLAMHGLKLPFLYLMPFVGFSILGWDSLNWLVVFNIIFWMVVGGLVGWYLWRLKR